MAGAAASRATPDAPPQAFVTGMSVRVDASQLAPIRRLHPTMVAVRLPHDADGLRATGAIVTGIPSRPAVLDATVTVSTRTGRTVLHWPIVVFAADLPTPVLPESLGAYSAARVRTPRHFLADVTGSAVAEDNSPRDNRVTDAGATLGRVLFYDTRLSARRSRSRAHRAIARNSASPTRRGSAAGSAARSLGGTDGARERALLPRRAVLSRRARGDARGTGAPADRRFGTRWVFRSTRWK